ncbi:MAG: peptidoglycan/xylan/chitin deacetylase (PgdA/CDA1 family) [Gammaproteobacteria bacterium]|jgi:peptidoglycan/xylan/chitin deacetylase (PgdA/CDA1 family)
MIDLVCRFSIQCAALLARRLPIVMYHRVLTKRDPIFPSVPTIDEFAREVKWLNNSFTIIPLESAIDQLFAGTLPARALCITFDDGYRDNLYNAVPVLLEHDVCATFFVTTGYMEDGMMWNDRIIESVRAYNERHSELDLGEHGLPRYALGAQCGDTIGTILADLKYRPFDEREDISKEIYRKFCGDKIDRPMLDAGEIARLHKSGMEIGGHTHCHPILSRLSDKQASIEISTNKTILEDIVGKPIRSFAYPNGRPNLDYESSHTKILSEIGFDFAVSTSAGAASQFCDPFQIPRFSPWDKSQMKYNLRMVRNYFSDPELAATSQNHSGRNE